MIIASELCICQCGNQFRHQIISCTLGSVNLIIVRQNDVILGHIFVEFHVAQFDYTMISWS